MLQQFAQIITTGMTFSRQSRMGSKQMTIYRAFIVTCLCGLLLTSFSAAKAQAIAEFALLSPLLVTVQQVDVNGDGRLERVEGNFQLSADNIAGGYLAIVGTDTESHLTIQSGKLWCNGGASAIDFSGSLRVRRAGREETFAQIAITIRPSVTVNSLWIASLGASYGSEQPVAFAAVGERELRVDPCAPTALSASLAASAATPLSTMIQ